MKMVTKRKVERSFCPFCGRAFVGDHFTCPYCGQDLRPYKDDLGPLMNKIQTATNIDMKSLKVRAIMSIAIFALVFAGSMFVLEKFYNHEEEQALVVEEPVIEESPLAEGMMLTLRDYGYMDLTTGFTNRIFKALPLYDPDLKLKISLNDKVRGNYTKVMWIVETDGYNSENPKNPFYLKATKDLTDNDMYSVTWSSLMVGGFWITACCYYENGECDVYNAAGTYYGNYTASYAWTFDDMRFKFEFTMPAEDVKACIDADLVSRMDVQSRSSMTDYIIENSTVTSLQAKLRTLYSNEYGYTDAKYTSFVLAFVQQCFPYMLDSYNYAISDYWAHPEETILWGCGDDEDRAILFCSLMKAAGLSVGLVILPETVMSAVLLDLTDPYLDGVNTVRGLYRQYVVADTSSDLEIGELPRFYSVSDDGRTLYYNGEIVHGRYGLEAI